MILPSLPAQVGAIFDRINLDLAAERGAQVIGVLVLMVVANRLLRVLTRRIERAVDDGDSTTLTERQQRGRTLAQLANSVGVVAIGLAGGLTILNVFVPIAPLLAGVGVAGLAISFGAQSLVKDVIAGFFLLMEDQFHVGDIIEVDGVGGVVERLTLRVVTLRDVRGVVHIIPNGSITRVSNKTRGWSRAVLDISVAYREDVDRVIAVMREVAGELWRDEEWKARLVEEPGIWGVEALGDSSVDIRLVATTQPGKQWEVAREVRRRIKNRFDREHIVIPFPQRTLSLEHPDQFLRLGVTGPASP